jgi:hypothetical protein
MSDQKQEETQEKKSNFNERYFAVIGTKENPKVISSLKDLTALYNAGESIMKMGSGEQVVEYLNEVASGKEIEGKEKLDYLNKQEEKKEEKPKKTIEPDKYKTFLDDWEVNEEIPRVLNHDLNKFFDNTNESGIMNTLREYDVSDDAINKINYDNPLMTSKEIKGEILNTINKDSEKAVNFKKEFNVALNKSQGQKM